MRAFGAPGRDIEEELLMDKKKEESVKDLLGRAPSQLFYMLFPGADIKRIVTNDAGCNI